MRLIELDSTVSSRLVEDTNYIHFPPKNHFFYAIHTKLGNVMDLGVGGVLEAGTCFQSIEHID